MAVAANLETASAATAQFSTALADIDTLGSLQAAMLVVTPAIGFDVFILLQLPGPIKGNSALLITSYPDGWIRSAIADRNYMDDPVITAARNADVAFVWDDIAAIIEISHKQNRYMAQARDVGLSNGFTVPFRLPGEPLGLVSFATASETPVNPTTLPFAYQVASQAFGHARAIQKRTLVTERARLALTRDEIGSVRYAAQGKSDFLIARIFGVTPAEVRRLHRSAQLKLGSTCRVSMVLIAINLGYFTVDEALFG